MLSTEHVALRSATAEIIEVSVDTLGINLEQLVRPIVEADVYELALKDESKWEPIEIRLWPAEWEKPTPSVLYHVISGNHRTRAAQVKQLRALRARLIEAPDELSYLVAAISSNTQHGRNFTRDEYIANAKKLQAQGLPLAEIASTLGYSKSTVSRWLTGADSHAAAKQHEPEEPVLNASYAPILQETSGDSVKRKVMGLLIDAQMESDVAGARAYVQTLKPAQQETLRQLVLWLQEVMHG